MTERNLRRATRTAKREPAVNVSSLRIERHERRVGVGPVPFTHDFDVWEVRGTAEQLVALQMCEADWFPEGRKRVSCGSFGPDDECGHWRLTRRAGALWGLVASIRLGRATAKPFEDAWAIYGDEAREPEAELFAPRREREADYSRRLALQYAFQHGPMEATGARHAFVTDVDDWIYMLAELLKRYNGPFLPRLSDEDSEELEEAIQTVRRLAQEAPLVRDKSISDRIVQYRRAMAARNDQPLQAFLRLVKS